MEERVIESGVRQALRIVAGERSDATPAGILNAHSAAEAVALLGMHGPLALPLAGGGDLLALLRDGVIGPRMLVNLATAPELARIERRADGMQIGAMVTLDRLAERPDIPPALMDAAEERGSARATLGGELLRRPRCSYFRDPAVACFKKGGATCPAASVSADSYPGALFPGVCHDAHASDLAPALIALDAHAEIAAWDGVRRQPLEALYRDAAFNREREVQLAQDELLSSIIVPDGPSAQGFAKVVLGSCSSVAAAAAIEIEGELIVGARIVASGVAPGPFTFGRARDLLAGRRAGDVDVARVACDLVQVETRLPIAERAAATRQAIERALSRALQRR